MARSRRDSQLRQALRGWARELGLPREVRYGRKGGGPTGPNLGNHAVAANLVRRAVENHELAIQVVERADAEVAVAKQLGTGITPSYCPTRSALITEPA